MAAREDILPLSPDEIEIAGDRRPVDDKAVRKLAQSIKEIGLRHPITVRSVDGRFVLVAGRHRLEACRMAGIEHVPAVISKLSKIDARLWEISENLHRAELTVQERSDQIAEWVRLTEEKRVSSQVATKPQGGRPESGERAAARELGLDKDEVNRANKIAGITDEAKEAARDAKLDDNQSALLRVARAEPENQVAVVHQLVLQKAASEPLNDLEANERQVAKLMTAWNAASPDARQEFLLRIEQPVMDRRYGG